MNCNNFSLFPVMLRLTRKKTQSCTVDNNSTSSVKNRNLINRMLHSYKCLISYSLPMFVVQYVIIANYIDLMYISWCSFGNWCAWRIENLRIEFPFQNYPQVLIKSLMSHVLVNSFRSENKTASSERTCFLFYPHHSAIEFPFLYYFDFFTFNCLHHKHGVIK